MSRLHELFPEGLSRPAGASWPDMLRAAPAGGAVYLITTSDGRLVQLAGTQQLRSALRARLTRPDEQASRRAKLDDVSSSVWWVRSGSPFETAYQFHLLARTLYPQSYRELCAIAPCWFARACPDDHLPRFAASDRIGGERGDAIGPFATRAACTGFIDAVEDVFDLCRYYDILQQTPHGTPCVYAEMNRCAVPCDGTQPLGEYRKVVREAVELATGRGQATIDSWRAQMSAAAAGQHYEQAAAFKRRLDSVGSLFPRGGKFARDAADFRYLIVQRAHIRHHARPFFARRAGVLRGEAVPIDALEQELAGWRRTLDEPTGDHDVDWTLASEQASLVTQFLEKRDRAAGAFLHRSELGDDAAMASAIRAALSKRPRDPASG
jgi:excinuclease UvrABC nuclease subunit